MPRTGQGAPDNADDYRWAVKRMIEGGLLEVVQFRTEPPSAPEPATPGPDDWVWAYRERRYPPEPPELLLRSTPELSARWQAGTGILVAPVEPKGTSPPLTSGVDGVPTNEQNGPQEPFFFSWQGQRLDLSDAPLRFRLLVALWNADEGKPASPRQQAQVMEEVWPDDEADFAFKDLCHRIRKVFADAAIPLTIKTAAGMVWLEQTPG